MLVEGLFIFIAPGGRFLDQGVILFVVSSIDCVGYWVGEAESGESLIVKQEQNSLRAKSLGAVQRIILTAESRVPKPKGSH